MKIGYFSIGKKVAVNIYRPSPTLNGSFVSEFVAYTTFSNGSFSPPKRQGVLDPKRDIQHKQKAALNEFASCWMNSENTSRNIELRG